MAESKIIPVFDQQAVADQLIHDKRIIHQRHQKPGLHPGTDQHSYVKRLTCRRTQRPGTGKDRITDGGRQGVAAGLQNLGDKERVASGQAIDFRRIDTCALRKCCYAACRKRRQAEPAGRPLACQRSEREPQRIVGQKPVVAVSHQEQHVQVLDPAAEVSQ
jgi:hypothetical protein